MNRHPSLIASDACGHGKADIDLAKSRIESALEEALRDTGLYATGRITVNLSIYKAQPENARNEEDKRVGKIKQSSTISAFAPEPDPDID
jgi:hypothetical protein